MNLLIDLLPTSVTIDGEEFEVNSDFRTLILFELLMLDDQDSKEKIIKSLELFYYKCPHNIEEAINKMLWFYRCGKEEAESKSTGENGISNRIYSFENDDSYIYSAFFTQYGIDLQDIEYLHWWKFKALFKSLTDENEFVKIMGYRSMDISKIKDKDQKAYYQKMKKIHQLPISKTDKEKTDALTEALIKGEDISKLLKLSN